MKIIEIFIYILLKLTFQNNSNSSFIVSDRHILVHFTFLLFVVAYAQDSRDYIKHIFNQNFFISHIDYFTLVCPAIIFIIITTIYLYYPLFFF